MEIPVSLDTLSMGVWWNAQQCWGMITPGATHHLVLQDDMWPCKNFIQSAKNALAANPDAPVSFFTVYKNIVDEARKNGGHWVLTSKIWGAAPCLPVWMIEDWLAWSEANVRPDFKHDDARLSAYLISKGIDVWNTVPSLAEHDLHGKKSLLGNNPPISRMARWFAGDGNNLDIDWSKGLDSPPRGSRVYLSAYKNIFKDGINAGSKDQT